MRGRFSLLKRRGHRFSLGGELIDAGEDALDDVVVDRRRVFSVGEV